MSLVVLALGCAALAVQARDQRPSSRDDEVFLQAAYLMRTHHLSPIEAITRAAKVQYGWGGALATRLRTQGDIQTYALLPVWSRVGGFSVAEGRGGRALYVESVRLQRASFAFFVVSVFVLYWAAFPLGRGVALVAAVLLLAGHPFRLGPTLFDTWVMPLAIASIGWWVRDRHAWAAAAALVAIIVKPNYVFLLPAFALAALVRPSAGDPPARRLRQPTVLYGGAILVTLALYLALAAAHVIAVGEYAAAVRRGYDPRVLAYSLLETVSFWYRAGTQQFRGRWPLYPWTLVNLVALIGFVAASWTGRMQRTAALVVALVVLPALANFAWMLSVAAYEDGGHFRWINVSIIAMAVALPLAYRETGRLVRARWRRPAAADA